MAQGDWIRQRVVTALVSGYKALNHAGVLAGPVAQRLFTHTYFTGKRYLEDNLAPFVARYPSVVSGGHVLDIGANIGYTAIVLARAIDTGFTVVAFEPERNNAAALRNNLAMFSVQDRVRVEEVAVGNAEGEVELWYNPGHHADHRILTDAFKATRGPEPISYKVRLTSIDSIIDRLGIAPIRFVKIDVQGYEYAVLEGMQRLIQANSQLTLLVEYAPQLLEELGFHPPDVLGFLRTRGFEIFVLERRGRLSRFVESSCEQRFRKGGYVDLVCSRTALQPRNPA